MKTWLKTAFFCLIVRPVILVVIGLNVRRRELLPTKGPAIVVANHNSHLDTMVLMTLFPLKMLPILRPVAAADYFLKTGLRAWFSTHVIGIIPLARQKQTQKETLDDRLAGVYAALDRQEIVFIFPEGSRGEPETLAELKSGIAHLASRRPEVPILPVFMHGLGKALPKGEALLVPFFCDVHVGEQLFWQGEREAFMQNLAQSMEALKASGYQPEWE